MSAFKIGLTPLAMAGIILFGNLIALKSDTQAQEPALDVPLLSNRGVVECSLFEAALLNAQTIRSADVLIRIVSSLDAVHQKDGELQGVTQDNTTWIRCAFDVDSARFLIARSGTQDILDLGVINGDLKNQKITEPRGWCIDCKAKRAFVSGSEEALEWRIFGKKEQDEILTAIDFFDPRTLGLGPAIDGTQLNRLRSRLQKDASGIRFLDRRIIDNQTVRIRLCDPESVDGRVRNTFDFDREKSVVVHCEWEAWHAQDNRWYPQDKYDFEWKTLNETSVPTKVIADEFEDVESANGRRYYGHRDTKILIHWFSVNEEIPAEVFDGSRIQSLSDLNQLLDPQMNQADDLIGNPVVQEVPKTKPGRADKK